MGTKYIGQIHSPVLVFLFVVCLEDVGDSCGRGRFMAGLVSMSASVVSRVVDIPEVVGGKFKVVTFC